MTETLKLFTWGSRSEMEAQMSAARRSLLIGFDSESPRFYYTLEVGGEIPLIIGLCASGLGPKPMAYYNQHQEKLVIGYDCMVVFVSAASGEVTTRVNLEAAFFEFIDLLPDRIIVIHELGAMSLSFDGTSFWVVHSSDVVENFRLTGGVLELSIMDSEAPARFSTIDGTRITD